MKDTKDKPRPSLVLTDMAQALLEVIKLTEFGATKYGPGNWQKVENGYREYTEAMFRHQLAETTEGIDPETGMPHQVAVAWNALARLWFWIEDNKLKAPETGRCDQR